MKRAILLFCLLITFSCALTPDFEFYFDINGQEFYGVGTSAAPFVLDDTLVIRIPKYPIRQCVAIVIDGNHHFKKDCKGKKGTFLTFDLGKVTPRTAKVVAMSVARKGSDTKSGKLYLGVANAEYEPLALDYECPYQSEIGNQFTCMRPSGFKFIFSMYPQEDGALQVYAPECAGISIKEVFNVAAGEELNFEIDNKIEGYCPIRIDFKSDTIKRSSTLHVDFYKI